MIKEIVIYNQVFLFYDPLLQFELLIKNNCWCSYDAFRAIRLFDFSRIQSFVIISSLLWYIYEITSVFNKKLINWKFKSEKFLEDFFDGSSRTFIIIWFQFAFLLFLFNCSGLLPFSLVLTGQLVVILCFSTIAFLIVIFEILGYKKFHYFNHFLPPGVPIFLVPLISSIEFISLISRIISIAVRIFANITAGHALLKIFSIFFFKVVLSGVILSIIFGTWFVLGISAFVFLLEVIVAGLQAYVFTTLLIIYISESRSKK